MIETPQDELAIKIRTIFDELDPRHPGPTGDHAWPGRGREGQGESSFSKDELVTKIQTIFDELDPQHMAIFRGLSPARRSEMVFEMCDFARRVVTASVLSRYPGISDKDLHRRVRERVMLAYEH